MNLNARRVLWLSFLLVPHLFLNGQNSFYSVSDGNFSSDIWSTSSSSTSPCSNNCFSDYYCSSDTIGLVGNKTAYIRDSVYTSCEMRLRGSFQIHVESGGVLTIDGGNDLLGDGSIVIDVGGQVYVTGDMDLTGNSLITVNGYLGVSGQISFAGNACINGSGTVEAASVNGSNNCPGANPILPIQLIDFRAVAVDNSVVLSWITASETNNDFFTIERTTDTKEFTEVFTLKGAGNSNERRSYAGTDHYPLQGVAYYRLKQTDFDGKFMFSPIIAVNIQPSEQFTVYPNPAGLTENPILNITGLEPDKEVRVQLQDLKGITVFSKIIRISSEGTGVFTSEPGHDLPAGVYLITATSDLKIYRQKLVVR